jgi:hypothetical protein
MSIPQFRRDSVRVFIVKVGLPLCLVGACYPGAARDVPGRYLAQAEWGQAVLDLRGDGTFVEEATLKSGTQRRVEGKWEYKREGGVGKVFREPCLRIDHAEINDQDWPYCSEGVVRYLFGGVELEIDPDFGFGYQK